MPSKFGSLTIDNLKLGSLQIDKICLGANEIWSSMTQLATPQNVSVSSSTASWEEVENATSYDLLVDGTVIGTYVALEQVGDTVTVNFTAATQSGTEVTI